MAEASATVNGAANGGANGTVVGDVVIGAVDDFHVHLRDGPMLEAIAGYTPAQFARGLVMPNLTPPVRKVADAAAYRDRILAALPEGTSFTPLMALYLTEETTAADVAEAGACDFVVAYKLYPAGATTNSASGVRDVGNVADALSAIEAAGLVLCVHGEVTDPSLDVFEREAVFVRTVLPRILSGYPRLKVILEHATTAVAAKAIAAEAGSGRLAATLTPHHLLHSRNSLFAGAKIRPDYFCLPLLKREDDRQALLAAIKGPHRRLFFAGTDSAPHTRGSKLCEAGCAGVFNAPAAVELYAKAFEEAGALPFLADFLGRNGADFYDLPRSEGSGILHRAPRKVPGLIPVVGTEGVKPLAAGETLQWRFSRE